MSHHQRAIEPLTITADFVYGKTVRRLQIGSELRKTMAQGFPGAMREEAVAAARL